MTEKNKDIRWEQRFSNYRKALLKLQAAIHIIDSANEGIPEAERQLKKEGLIQRFEYTHELGWNVMKDYAEYQGSYDIKGSRDATREAYKMGLVADAEAWMDMIKSRNETTHTYKEEVIEEIYHKIVEVYYPVFLAFDKKMTEYQKDTQAGIFGKEL